MADIGDAVRSGQELAEIEAAEMDEQIRQAKAALQQAQAGVNQALSNLKRGQADTELARITAQRRVREAIKKIGEVDAELAGELDRAVRTGTYCSWNPVK